MESDGSGKSMVSLVLQRRARRRLRIRKAQHAHVYAHRLTKLITRGSDLGGRWGCMRTLAKIFPCLFGVCCVRIRDTHRRRPSRTDRAREVQDKHYRNALPNLSASVVCASALCRGRIVDARVAFCTWLKLRMLALAASTPGVYFMG